MYSKKSNIVWLSLHAGPLSCQWRISRSRPCPRRKIISPSHDVGGVANTSNDGPFYKITNFLITLQFSPRWTLFLVVRSGCICVKKIRNMRFVQDQKKIFFKKILPDNFLDLEQRLFSPTLSLKWKITILKITFYSDFLNATPPHLVNCNFVKINK